MVWTDYSWWVYINPSGIVSALMWATILLILAHAKANLMLTIAQRKLYLRTVYYKMGFSVVFGLVYILIIGGGDTLAYFEATRVMHDKFFYNPEEYFEQIFTTPKWENYYTYFNRYVGYPPSFIYREPESYFVSKVTTILSFATFKSYFATNLIYAYLAANASWKIFMLAARKKIFNNTFLAIGVLFMPSVAFWTSGVSKDALVFISLMYLTYHIYTVLYIKKSNKLFNIVSILFFSFIVYKTRSFILFALLGSFGAMIILRYIYSLRRNIFLKTVSKIALYGAILFSMTRLMAVDESTLTSESDLISEAKLVQEDFAQNETYGAHRYSLGDISYSPLGIIKTIPIAVLTGIYRPWPWEARSALIAINGVESIFLVYLTIQFFKGKKIRMKVDFIRNNELLLFAFIFTFIIAFMAGFSSIIFGVLVRIRAPLLPFAMMLLCVDWKKIIKAKMAKKEKQDAINSLSL